MKRKGIVFCAAMCSALLGACKAEQQKTDEVKIVSMRDIVVSGTMDSSEEQPAEDSSGTQTDDMQPSGSLPDTQTDNAQPSGSLPDTQTDNAQPDETVISGEQSAQNSAEVCVLMAGGVGTMGTGWLVYTVPAQDNEDYRLYFFKSEDLSKAWNKADFNLENPDYIFPDVRENNASIGRFDEVYLGEFIDVTGSGAAELVVIASYDVDGKTCYDTRVYQADQNGYSASTELIQELNGKYCNAAEYPVQELYRRSTDTGR